MSQRRFLLGALVVLIGVSALTDLPLFNIAFTLLIIWLGVRIMTGSPRSDTMVTKGETSDKKINRVLIFSGIDQKNVTNDFEGGELVAVFGGGQLDLTGSKTKRKEIDLEVVAVFGGLKVLIPDNWEVRSEGVGIVGGFNNGARARGKTSTVINLKGAAIFGGVEISN